MDLRYHLISVAGVFLALAVGMLVGSSFLAGSSVEGLRGEFSQLRDENNRQRRAIDGLLDRIKKHKDFEGAAAPMIVNGRLSWQRVAIIQTGDYNEATQSARSALESAGARVESVTTFSNLDAADARERVARAVELITETSGSPDPIGALLGIVAESVVTGSNPEAIAILEEKHLLSKAGEYNRRVQNIVVVGGSKRKSEKRPQRIDLVLLEKLKEFGADVVACEPLDVRMSYVPIWSRKINRTVDNVDDPIGQVALVFVVAGETGNFGMKKSADRILPEYLEERQWQSGYRR